MLPTLTMNAEERVDTSRVYDLDEVVVVAQPKEVQKLRRQPLQSTLFTGHDLRQLGVNDMSRLAAFVPSMSIPAYGSRLTSSTYVRGIGSRTGNAAVGVYYDNIPLSDKSQFNRQQQRKEQAAQTQAGAFLPGFHFDSLVFSHGPQRKPIFCHPSECTLTAEFSQPSK